MTKKLFFFLAAIFINTALLAQNNDAATVKKISDEIMTHSNAYENLRYLTKKIGPRLSGSANAQKAVEATARMLKAAGADTVYLQPCMVPHWVRGAKETGYITLADGTKHDLRLVALGNAVGSGSKGIQSSVVEVSNLCKNFQSIWRIWYWPKGRSFASCKIWSNRGYGTLIGK